MLCLEDVHTPPSVVVSAIVISVAIIFPFSSIYGFIANSKRKKQEEDQQYPVNERRQDQFKRTIITSYYPFNKWDDGKQRCTIVIQR